MEWLFDSYWRRALLACVPLMLFFSPRLWLLLVRRQSLDDFRAALIEKHVRPLFREGEKILAVSGLGSAFLYIAGGLAALWIVVSILIVILPSKIGAAAILTGLALIVLLLFFPYRNTLFRISVVTTFNLYTVGSLRNPHTPTTIPGESIRHISIIFGRSDSLCVNGNYIIGRLVMLDNYSEFCAAISKLAILARRRAIHNQSS